MNLPVVDLGRMPYAKAFEAQQSHYEAILASRETAHPITGRLLLVEHDPVVTVTRRPEAADHLIASPEHLARLGIDIAQTNRGGDITYHGPGQLVVYPIIDLNALGLRLHEYMRRLEQAVINTIAQYGLEGIRDAGATGVWVQSDAEVPAAKICAMGVRVQRWITLHGLALNVTTNLSHFGTIVPCGLAGRPVTSLEHELGSKCPPMRQVKSDLCAQLSLHLADSTRSDQG